jgi:hypothetical protein
LQWCGAGCWLFTLRTILCRGISSQPAKQPGNNISKWIIAILRSFVFVFVCYLTILNILILPLNLMLNLLYIGQKKLSTKNVQQIKQSLFNPLDKQKILL